MTEKPRPQLGAILLAAGGSSRLGTPKQLLEFEGKTLLRRAAETLASTSFFPVVVVLGSEYETALDELDGLPVFGVNNRSWADGMSTSIRAGLETMADLGSQVDGVLITLCDQPRISSEMLDRFAEHYSETNAPVIAAEYSGTVGVPTLFSRELFGELTALQGDQGARAVIRDRSDVAFIELPEAAFDIDTREDVEKLAG